MAGCAARTISEKGSRPSTPSASRTSREVESGGHWHNMPVIDLRSSGIRTVQMPTRNVVVTAHQAEMIEQLVKSGRYQNASEVLREGLRRVEESEAETQAKLNAVREAANVV